MIEQNNDKKNIVVSADAARGAGGPRSGTFGDTLLPMLFWVIVLTAIGVATVAVVIGGHFPL